MSPLKEEVHGGKPLRCFCTHHPLLAVFKVSRSGKPYVHIKVYKGSRVYAEIIFHRGSMDVRCRECLRFHKVRIVSGNAVLEAYEGQPHPE